MTFSSLEQCAFKILGKFKHSMNSNIEIEAATIYMIATIKKKPKSTQLGKIDPTGKNLKKLAALIAL